MRTNYTCGVVVMTVTDLPLAPANWVLILPFECVLRKNKYQDQLEVCQTYYLSPS